MICILIIFKINLLIEIHLLLQLLRINYYAYYYVIWLLIINTNKFLNEWLEYAINDEGTFLLKN